MKHLFNKILTGVSDTFYVWKQEMKNIFRDQGVLIFFFVVPLGYPLLYTFIYTNEVIRDVPAVAVDNSRSSYSRDFLRKVDATPDVEVVAYASDMEEAKRLLREKKAYGIIYIPSEFSKDINTGKQTQVSLYCDMSGLLYYKAILTACTGVSLELNNQIQISRMGNSTEREDEVSTHPIEYSSVALFNAQNGFASFLIPAVLILIIQQTLLLGIGLSVGTARDRNRFRDIIPIDRHYQGTLRTVLGKASAYLIIYMLMSSYMLIVVPHLFSLIQIAEASTVFTFVLPYLLACIFFAMTASVIIINRETCMLIFVFTSVPLLFISGISWPGTAVPQFWKYMSYLFPSTFGINGFVRINSMGATLGDVINEYRALWVQAGFYFCTTFWIYRHQLIINKRHISERWKNLKAKYGNMKGHRKLKKNHSL